MSRGGLWRIKVCFFLIIPSHPILVSLSLVLLTLNTYVLVSLSSIPYIDRPEIKFTRKESVIMPFRYVATTAVVTGADGTEKTVRRPVMPPGMIELLKKDNEKGFEF